ncbi:MAG: DEAD/DEAH box helicase, partial [Chloroflexi bacterium]|nr:DEAD/DEAH box helicase [Chloroflexota bacterium]
MHRPPRNWTWGSSRGAVKDPAAVSGSVESQRLGRALQAIRTGREHAAQIAAWRLLPEAPPAYGEIPPALDPRLAERLAGWGVPRLYAHQAEAVGAALAGRDVAVVTPTASGKTLCYNLPVLQALLEDPLARAL